MWRGILEQVLFKRDVTIENETETSPALPIASVTKQEIEQPAVLFPDVPGVAAEDVKSVIDACISGIAKRDICSHLGWGNSKYGRVVKPVLDLFLTGK